MSIHIQTPYGLYSFFLFVGNIKLKIEFIDEMYLNDRPACKLRRTGFRGIKTTM